MFAKTSSTSSKISFFVLALMMVLIPSSSAFAQGAGSIPIEKDVLLEFPIQGAEDLPDAVTFSLYDSEDAVTPLATQAFPRGEYTLDFDFNKSDGLSSGTIARFKVNFTNKLNLGDSADTAEQPKEIWAEFSVGDSVMGSRSLLPDDAMVQLLLASDASIATYLTLAYEGDDNPITTIYKNLPLGGDGSSNPFERYFSVATSADSRAATDNTFPVSGNVGIGTTTPSMVLHVKGADQALDAAGDKWFYYKDGNGGTGANNADAAFGWRDSIGAITLWTPESGDILIAKNDGNVGIGTTSPGTILHVKGADQALDAAGDKWFYYKDGNGGTGANNADAAFGWRDSIGAITLWTPESSDILVAKNNGNVGIGTTNPSYKLAVNGSIGCTELTVTTSGWADFVFRKGYNLPTLKTIEAFIVENKHLPGIPTEAEVKRKGISVGEISTKLLQKVEELTLYVIDLKKENNSLKTQLVTIQEQLKRD